MLEWMQTMLDKFLDSLIKVLPVSPFMDFIDELDKLPYLNYLNWFVPVGTLIGIGSAWLVAIGVYYMYSILARWIKLIG